MFITILEKCVVEAGDKAKSLNKLYDCLIKIQTAYNNFQSQKDMSNSHNNPCYDFYVCITDDNPGP